MLVILFKQIQLCTKRSKLMAPSHLLSYFLKSERTNGLLNRYPNAINAFVYSSMFISPLPSASKWSKRVRQEPRNSHKPQNSSKFMVLVLLVSNKRIIVLIVSGSNGDQSPFTRAWLSSLSDSWPLPIFEKQKRKRISARTCKVWKGDRNHLYRRN